ncbi:MAG: ASCH domain-containing protein [Eubacterium sp.]|nr:ASCH domain-containing protein [Eubacterium sp.]
MKAVLISIKPKWCELIKSGKKTIEIRKNAPRLKPPFKCYIYECKGRLGKEIAWRTWEYEGSGKIIGEFFCNRIDEIYQCNSGYASEKGCISRKDFFEYLGIPYDTHFGYDKHAFAWHISDLIIYDEPKDLNQFVKACPFNNCYSCKYYDTGTYWEPPTCNYEDWEGISRPPQSWCYVEVGINP